ncbi:MAG TPA: bifunctional salicylyl-CoA 5-hydroxylase/oxidoreductase [Geminicoccaceae bacterium]|nr:bifunctional salicylyl-CoA 5-hydroxylase/oxidoreductase [Geminicoccaceae bacterium]
MKVVCVGGGPAGLYLAISMKLRDPAHDVLVLERNRADDTFGWGVVFSNETLGNLWRNDADSAAAIEQSFQHWDDIDVRFKGHVVRSGGHGFAGIARKRLLHILQERARGLGVRLRFEHEVEDLAAFRDADLIVAADGINSRIRERFAAAFRPSIELRTNKYIWLGTDQPFEAFTFAFEETPQGWIWAHAYRFDAATSTFIVECGETTWRGLGFDRMSTGDSVAACEMLFERHLGGHRLMSNAKHLRGSAWLHFPRVACERWHHDEIVLLGDAAHSAHFSIGSGTKLALEDAIGLADALHGSDDLQAALAAYQQSRQTEVLKLQSAARNSTEWFEAVPRYTGFEPMQFAYALLTRSQRVSHENLRLRDRTWLEGMEQWFAERASGHPVQVAVPPMFTPFRLRGLELVNRVAVSPMAMYSAKEGVAGDFHLVHLGARAQGGAGLVFTEMTCVGPQARITPGCAGMWDEAHVAAWTRIVDFVHAHSEAKICLQLGHAGPKGSTRLGWEGMDEPLESGNWPLIGPSPVPWSPAHQVPRAMTRDDMQDVLAAFVRATGMAERCGFDMVELHCAHGYLLSAFITPLMNRRTDAYGGTLANRLRFPLEVFSAMRAAWPQHRPMSVRISATDWVDGGISGEDSVAIAKAFAAAGADVIDVSAGQTSTRAAPVYGRMFQTPFADRIRNEAGIATMAVGNIFEPDHVNSIIAAGRADICCLARPHLADPYWTLHAAAQLGYDQIAWPLPYLAGRDQLVRNMRRAADLAVAV